MYCVQLFLVLCYNRSNLKKKNSNIHINGVCNIPECKTYLRYAI